MNGDQLAGRLLAIFLVELEEQLVVLNGDLLALEQEPRDGARLASVFRIVHTLKGAAHAAHVPEVEEVCHTLESLLANAREGKLLLGPQEFALLFAVADALATAREQIAGGAELADSPLARLLLRLREGLPERGEQLPAAAAAPAEPETPTVVPATSSAGPEATQVRVEAEKLDGLLSAASELLVTAARVASRPAELEELHEVADRRSAAWQRSARRLRLAGEGTRDSAAICGALEEVEQTLRHIARETGRLAALAREDARILSQATQEIGHRVRRLRLRPFADACIALPRAARDLAAASEKEVRLEIEGGGVEADRAVLDLLHEALLQLVRNAVDHGIETPAEREAAGKPSAGTVTVSAALQGHRLLVTVEDDGRGIDEAAIREQLARQGLSVPESQEDLTRLLFGAGFSTRSHATSISGRGVGLDVVAAAMERARGNVLMDSTPGRGTTFTLECAPSLATVHVLLVMLGSQILAIPSAHVQHLVLARPDEIRKAEGRVVLLTSDGPVPLVSLASLLGRSFLAEPIGGPVPVVCLLAGGRALAATVDALLGVEEIVVRPIEGVATPPPLVSGAALLGTGRVAVVLNTAAIVADGLRSPGPGVDFGETRPAAAVRKRILVVDDSITTRTLEQSILEAAGYEVLTAVDGRDAWRILQERGCDLLVSDVEMPHMDGIELCSVIRASARLARLPVVLVTALDAPEHRERGLEAGADAYLPKSSFDHQDLLQVIEQLLG